MCYGLPPASSDDLLDRDLDGRDGTVGAERNKAVAVAVEAGPERGLVGFGDREALDGFAGPEGELALADVRRETADRPLAAKQEHQPMRVPLIGFLRDHREQVQVLLGDDEAGFLGGFADGALQGGFPGGHLEFAADGRPHPQVGLFGAQHQELLAGVVLNEDEYADLVGQGGGHRSEMSVTFGVSPANKSYERADGGRSRPPAL